MSRATLPPKPAQSSPTLSTAIPSVPIPESTPLSSGHTPNPDPEDHLTLKKLKASHPQEITLQPQATV